VPTEILESEAGLWHPIDRWINEQLRERVARYAHRTTHHAAWFIEPRYVNLLLDEHERGTPRSYRDRVVDALYAWSYGNVSC